MPTKSPPAGRTDHAENESFALRGLDSICAVHLGRAGSDYEAHRPRAVALRAPLLRLFSARHLRPELADVPRPRLTCPSRHKGLRRLFENGEAKGVHSDHVEKLENILLVL